MDSQSKALDKKYRGIYETEKRSRLCKEILCMFADMDIASEIVLSQVSQKEQELKDLESEYARQRQEQIDDFMVVEDIMSLRVLKMWYIEHLSWKDISEKTKKSKVWILKLRDNGLVQIASKVYFEYSDSLLEI